MTYAARFWFSLFFVTCALGAEPTTLPVQQRQNALALKGGIFDALEHQGKIYIGTILGIEESSHNPEVNKGVVTLRVDEAIIPDNRKQIRVPYVMPNKDNMLGAGGYIWLEPKKIGMPGPVVIELNRQVACIFLADAIDPVAGEQGKADGAMTNVWYITGPDDQIVRSLRRIAEIYSSDDAKLTPLVSAGVADASDLVRKFSLDLIDAKWFVSNPECASTALIQAFESEKWAVTTEDGKRAISILHKMMNSKPGSEASKRIGIQTLKSLMLQGNASLSQLSITLFTSQVAEPGFPKAADLLTDPEQSNIRDLLGRQEPSEAIERTLVWLGH